jgi:hypothetical protein
MARLIKIITLTLIISCCAMAGIYIFMTPDFSAPPSPTTAEFQQTVYDRIAKKDCKDYIYGSNDGPEGRQRVQADVSKGMQMEINTLEVDINNWNGKGGTKESCLFDDGQPWIGEIDQGYAVHFNMIKNQNGWIEFLNRIQQLRAKHPKSISLALLESQYWKMYAWDARGNGLSSTVTEDGYRLFNERMQKAETVLLEIKPYASSLPVWHTQMLAAQHILDRSPEEINGTFIEGASKNKRYYPLYFTMLNFNLPKWGGTWEGVDYLVNWSIKNTQDTEGNSMYARMYWSVYGGLLEGTKLFEDTYATWSKMKIGFEDLMQRYPKSNWNLNNFAKFACLAGDKETFLTLRKQIGDNIHNAAWRNDATLDLCEHKMEYVKSEI